MRGAVTTSTLVHLAVLAVIFAVRGPAPVIVPGPDVVQVALVEPTSTAAIVASRSAPPRTRVEPAEVAPEPGEGIKLAPERRRREKVEPPKPDESEPAAPTLPFATVGNAGLRGQVAVDAHDFAFTYYLMLVRNRVAQNWSPPAGLASAQPVQGVVYFRIARDGTISGLRLETGSTLEFFDRSTLRAVMLSDPLPPLPLGFGGPWLGVHFGFQYVAP